MMEYKGYTGKVEYDANWQELEERELGETGFPQ